MTKYVFEEKNRKPFLDAHVEILYSVSWRIRVSSVRVGETNRNVVIVGEEALSDREIDILGYIVDGYQKKRYAKNIASGDTILNWEGRGGFVLNLNHQRSVV